MTTTGSGVRLSELLGAMSFGIDLAMGNPPEHVLRQTVLSLRLADRLGLDDDARRLLRLSLRDFRRAGVDRDDETRARIRTLSERQVEVDRAAAKLPRPTTS